MKRYSIRQVAPTLARLLGVRAPNPGAAKPIPAIADDQAMVDRCLVFAVDSVPEYMLRRKPDRFRHTLRLFSRPLQARAVYPPVTPVCFASMFTGLAPRHHGITRYEKPILACETLFDILVEAGRRPAIVAVRDQSLDRIFRSRKMKYYSERYDPEVVKRTVTILKADRHDVVVAYNQAYDDANHATDPLSPRSLAALGQYDAHAATLFSAFQRHWRSYRRLFLWVTDHGCHVDSRTGKGTHGRRIAEDMHVPVFFRIEPGSQN